MNRWTFSQLHSRTGGTFEAYFYNDGGDKWKVEIRRVDNGALLKRRYFSGLGSIKRANEFVGLNIRPGQFGFTNKKRGFARR